MLNTKNTLLARASKIIFIIALFAVLTSLSCKTKKHTPDTKETEVKQNNNLTDPYYTLVDNFSVRWNGMIYIPIAGNYTFYTESDDGVKLFIGNNENPIIDNWTNHTDTENIGEGMFDKGLYPIELWYFENTMDAKIRLSWSRTGMDKQIVPADNLYNKTQTGKFVKGGLYGNYFAGNNFEERIKGRVDSTIDFYWSSEDGPFRINTTDDYSVDWTGSFKPLESGYYSFKANTKESISITAGYDSCSATGETEDCIVSIRANSDDTKYFNIKYQNNSNVTNDDRFNLLWSYNLSPFYDLFERCPIVGCSHDNFAVRWSGKIKVVNNGKYTFVVKTSDKVNIWIGEQKTPYTFVPANGEVKSFPVEAILDKGMNNLKLEFMEKDKGAYIELLWVTDEGKQVTVPADMLYYKTNGRGFKQGGLNATYYQDLIATNPEDLSLEFIDWEGANKSRIDAQIKFNWAYSDFVKIESPVLFFGRPIKGEGLIGTYYENVDFTKIAFKRIDKDFNLKNE